MTADLASALMALADAAVGLLRGIPGMRSIEVRNWGIDYVVFVCETDELVLAAIEALGMTHRQVVSVCRTATWHEGTCVAGDIQIRVTGPHTAIQQVVSAAPGIDADRLTQSVDAAKAVAKVRAASRVITAETITDEQIRELLGTAVDAGDTQLWRICEKALGNRDASVALSRTGARVRCAEILAARQAVSK